MIVICEECGKKYRLDPEKMQGNKARFKCKACGHFITASKPEAAPVMDGFDTKAAEAPDASGAEAAVQDFTKPAGDFGTAAEAVARVGSVKRKGLGLRAKMIALFFVIPIILIAASSLVYLWQLRELALAFRQKSAEVAAQQGEIRVVENARSIASQCKLYFLSHPNIHAEAINFNPELKRLAVQKVGLTGSSFLFEIPGPDGIWRIWAHVDPEWVGRDMSTAAKSLGKHFPNYWKIITDVEGGGQSRGSVMWPGPGNTVKQKYMVCVPIEGTRYVIGVTVDQQEFQRPAERVAQEAWEGALRVRNISFVNFGVTLLLIGVVVSLYGHSLTNRIKSLTDIADRISVGELDVEVEAKSKDEIGDLAESISRMQDSIRLSIERLRRRR